jgi:hypothetical protein
VRRTGRNIEHGSYLLQKAKSRTKAAALSHHLDQTRGCGYAGEKYLWSEMETGIAINCQLPEFRIWSVRTTNG